MACGRCLEVCGESEEVIDAPTALDPVWMQEARKGDDYPTNIVNMPGDLKQPTLPSRPSQHSLDSEANVDMVEFGENGTPDQSKRKAHRHRMDEHEVLDKAWWCCYCICGGWGCTEEPATVHLISKCCCCCSETCEMIDTGAVNHEGSCSFVHTCCFCTSLCQWPFREGTPVCILCGGQFCGWHGRTKTGGQKPSNKERRISETDEEKPPSMFDHALQEQCMLLYCCGCGLACAGTILEIYDSFTKCGCCRCTLGLSPPWSEDGVCTHILNMNTCHSQCRCPVKKESNPLIACCGRRFKKIHPHGRNIGVGVAGNSSKPKQQEMR